MNNTKHINVGLKLSLVTAAITGLALLAQTATAQQWTTNNLPTGLISWWNADGNTLDATGVNPASSSGQTYGPGRFGEAFHFNGINQSVAAPGSASLDQWTQFTLEAWIKLDQTADVPAAAPGRMIINRVGNAADHVNFNQGYQFGFWDNARRFVLNFNTNNQAWPGLVTEAVLPASLPTNVWLHVAATYDHNAVTLYLDGAPQRTNVIGAATVAHSTSAFRIGMDDNGNCPFAGSIDDVRVYSRALSQSEIAYLSAGPPLPGLISWWRGEGDASDTMGVHPGTPLGGLGYAAGQVGQAFSLDGQNAAVALGNWFTLQQFTLSLWVKPGPTQVEHADILDNNHTAYRSWVFQSANVSDATRSHWLWGTSEPSGGGAITFALTHNAWQHWIVTLGADRVQRLYLDGKLAGSTTNTAPIPYDGTQSLHIGQHHLLGRFFKGLVDECMVFNRPLSAAEVASLYVSQGGRPTLAIQPQPSGVLLSWPAGAANPTLESRTDLGSGSWEAMTNALILPAGDRSTVLLPTSVSQRFFRLKAGN